MQKDKKKREVIVIFHNHVDPEWARCFEKYAYNGRFLTRSYMDIFEWMADEAIRLSGQGFCYSEGQTVFWEKYLEKNPDKRESVHQMADEGRLELLMQGFLTCDTNYVPAEGIIRNYLLAQPFYREYGRKYPVDQAFVWDAFGSSANLPQILKQFGARRVGGTKYRPCTEDYWVGLDGSKLPCIDRKLGSCNLAGEPILYVCARHPHCPDCLGYGCEKCGGRGMLNRHPFRKEEVIRVLEQCMHAGDERKFVLIGGEEVIPDQCILDAVNEMNAAYHNTCSFRFGTLREFWEYHREEYGQQEENYTEPGRELNPVNQGGYLTRIKNKQRVRKAAYALLQGEAAYASALFETDRELLVPEEFNRAWKYLLMNMHHDSISGAHIDTGQRELMEWLEKCEEITASYYIPDQRKENREPVRILRKGQVYHKKLGELEVSFDLQGITAVLTDGEDLFGEYQYQYTAPREWEEPVHIGELMIQDDIGDLYGTYLFGEGICLGKYHYCVMEEDHAIIWKGSRAAGDPSASKLEWETRAEASEDGKRLNFTVRMCAALSNKRISALIPVNDRKSDTAVWEIPYGFLERRYLSGEEAEREISDYYVPSLYERTAILPTGDYPALHWVRHDITEEKGIAVLNRGLPCNKYIPGCFVLGLVRAPMLQGVTIMPNADEMWDIHEIGKEEEYLFEFSVYPMNERVSCGSLTRLGYQYNDAILPLPFSVEGNVVVTAFKVAEDTRGFIVRMFETEGTDSTVRIQYKKNHRTSVVMANETEVLEESEGTEFMYTMHRHEILTLRIQ